MTPQPPLPNADTDDHDEYRRFFDIRPLLNRWEPEDPVGIEIARGRIASVRKAVDDLPVELIDLYANLYNSLTDTQNVLEAGKLFDPEAE